MQQKKIFIEHSFFTGTGLGQACFALPRVNAADKFDLSKELLPLIQDFLRSINLEKGPLNSAVVDQFKDFIHGDRVSKLARSFFVPFSIQERSFIFTKNFVASLLAQMKSLQVPEVENTLSLIYRKHGVSKCFSVAVVTAMFIGHLNDHLNSSELFAQLKKEFTEENVETPIFINMIQLSLANKFLSGSFVFDQIFICFTYLMQRVLEPELSLAEKTAIVVKLCEGVAKCTGGFLERIQEQVEQQKMEEAGETLVSFLSRMRRKIFDTTFYSREAFFSHEQSVHAREEAWCIADSLRLGLRRVPPLVQKGWLRERAEFENKLTDAFRVKYSIPQIFQALMCYFEETFKSYGYCGKEIQAGYPQKFLREVQSFLNGFLPLAEIGIGDVAEVDDDYYNWGLDWHFIRCITLKTLCGQGFFKPWIYEHGFSDVRTEVTYKFIWVGGVQDLFEQGVKVTIPAGVSTHLLVRNLSVEQFQCLYSYLYREKLLSQSDSAIILANMSNAQLYHFGQNTYLLHEHIFNMLVCASNVYLYKSMVRKGLEAFTGLYQITGLYQKCGRPLIVDPAMLPFLSAIRPWAPASFFFDMLNLLESSEAVGFFYETYGAAFEFVLSKDLAGKISDAFFSYFRHKYFGDKDFIDILMDPTRLGILPSDFACKLRARYLPDIEAFIQLLDNPRVKNRFALCSISDFFMPQVRQVFANEMYKIYAHFQLAYLDTPPDNRPTYIFYPKLTSAEHEAMFVYMHHSGKLRKFVSNVYAQSIVPTAILNIGENGRVLALVLEEVCDDFAPRLIQDSSAETLIRLLNSDAVSFVAKAKVLGCLLMDDPNRVLMNKSLRLESLEAYYNQEKTPWRHDKLEMLILKRYSPERLVELLNAPRRLIDSTTYSNSTTYSKMIAALKDRVFSKEEPLDLRRYASILNQIDRDIAREFLPDYKLRLRSMFMKEYSLERLVELLNAPLDPTTYNVMIAALKDRVFSELNLRRYASILNQVGENIAREFLLDYQLRLQSMDIKNESKHERLIILFGCLASRAHKIFLEIFSEQAREQGCTDFKVRCEAKADWNRCEFVRISRKKMKKGQRPDFTSPTFEPLIPPDKLVLMLKIRADDRDNTSPEDSAFLRKSIRGTIKKTFNAWMRSALLFLVSGFGLIFSLITVALISQLKRKQLREIGYVQGCIQKAKDRPHSLAARAIDRATTDFLVRLTG